VTEHGPTRRRGRGSAAPGATRDAILTAARAEFARAGYAGATVRAIAAAAGVDPALVMHYFGTKDALFAETLRASGGLVTRIGAAFEGPADGLARRLAATYLALWEDPETAPVLAGVVRSALSSPIAADAVRRLVEGSFLEQAGGRWAPERLNLAGAQLLGIAVARYIVRTEPLASMDRDAVVDLVAPRLQGLLES